MGVIRGTGIRSARVRFLLLAITATLAMSSLWASSAQAIRVHNYVSSATGPSLSNPYGIAVDNSSGPSSGALYAVVPPAAPPKVVKFDADGNELSTINNANLTDCAGAKNFNNPFDVAVDSSNGEVYVGDPGAETLTAFDPSGNCLFQIGEGLYAPYGMAVDPNHGANGILYVVGYSIHSIQSFDAATGAPISSFETPPGVQPVFSLAVDSAGNIFADYFQEKVVKYDPSGECLNECTPIDTAAPQSIAINSADDHLFVGSFAQISEYKPGGTSPAIAFGQGKTSQYIFGTAVNAASGRVYGSDFATNSVSIFDPGAILPGVTTDPATNPGQTSATLTGHVDPEGGGDITSCHFAYGTDTSYAGGTVPCVPAAPISGATEVHADLSGLTTETTYHYRLVATNANGDNVGGDRTVTPHAVIGLQTEAATGVTRTAAQLNGSFVGNGEDTHYYFEWGTTTGYGNTTPALPGVDAGSGVGPTAASVNLTELAPGTEYHFRVVAKNGSGTTIGEDRSFRALPSVGQVKTENATGVTRTAAQLNGSFVGNGEDTHYYFEWGTDQSYGHTTPALPGVDAGSGAGPTAASVNLTELTPGTEYHFRIVAVNAVGTTLGGDRKFTSVSAVPNLKTEAATGVTRTSAQLNGSFVGNGEDTHYYFEWGTNQGYGNTTPAPPGVDAGSGVGPTAASVSLTELTPGTEYHFRVVAKNAVGTSFGEDRSFATPPAVAAVTTKPATSVTATSAQLNGSFVGNGEDTHYFFEWGTNQGYGNTTPAPPGVDAGSGAGLTQVNVNLGGISPITEYHFRLVAKNAVGTTYGLDGSFTTPPSVPLFTESVSDVHSESATLHGQINPGGGSTKYRFEYAAAAEYEPGETYSHSVPVPDGELGSGTTYVPVVEPLVGLTPGTTYHWRLVATNVTGTTSGPDRTFRTFPFVPVLEDSCANVHVRQQTGAAQLLDCRAYELVSAANTAGYDVESDLVPNQSPYPDYPDAEAPARVLYSVHDGGIPGTDHPTNRGPDPYVATRDPQTGWSTEYVGVPANNPFAAEPFSSIRSGADASLQTLAFGGPDGCSPCFEGGYTGIPVRLPDGSIVQGMSGPEGPGPGAQPDGYIAKNLSADGEHFIFGSTSRFAPGGNSGGDVSIYDHNLQTGQTAVVSNAPGGGAIPCLQGAGKCNAANNDSNGISELDISADGSRILIGQKVATDADGNVYWHLFMDIADAAKSIDITPGATHGVRFDGMTEDGSEVFFATVDSLSGADTDTSADLYAAAVTSSSATLSLVSTGTGGAGNTNACEPVANLNGEHWNSVGSAKNCDVLGIGGGGGIGTADGSAYFLSPEKLDGAANGTANQPNLYVARPGAAPAFIATLDPDDAVVVDSLKEGEVRHTGDFQVTPGGDFAAFATDRRLNEYANAGYTEVYRYDASADSTDCVSCNPSNAEATADASMAGAGLSLTTAGQVFFNSNDALVLPDADNRPDVYEWEPQGTGSCQPESPAFFELSADCVSLISSGTGQFGSSLLGVSRSGTDAYFFTRASMTPQVENGPKVKIYDARELGGFPYSPEKVPCKASDECHGPGTPVPPRPTIPTGAGTAGNLGEKRKCKSGFVRRHGRCVRKHRPSHGRHRGGKK